jgi:GDP-4-dehydro-6-deoxy-D-mannose reductase
MSEVRVLVTGAGGFVAGALARQIARDWPQARVLGVGRHTSSSPAGFPTAVLDLNDTPALTRWLAELQPQYVLHAAGRVQGSAWPALYRDNVTATLSLLDAVTAAVPQARVVIAGSAAECGMVKQLPVEEAQALHPVSPYGVSKAWQSLAALSHAHRGLHVTVARIFNVVGQGTPAFTALGTFAQQLIEIRAGRREPVLHTGALDSRRDFVDIADIASALLQLAGEGQSGETYNVCSGRSVGVGEVLALMIELSGLHVQLEVEASRLRPGDVPDVFGCPAKIQAACGWSAQVPLSASLSAMLDEPG